MIIPISELYTHTTSDPEVDWSWVVAQQHCRYLDKKCVKIRKSNPESTIGTCTVAFGKRSQTQLVICPHRFLEAKRVFLDCVPLLSRHVPNNELHIIPEVEIPGGSVDYLLISLRDQQVVDFVGLELQAVDTTGTIWPSRQYLLKQLGVIDEAETIVDRAFGVNWKMTAKTTLVQLHHKISTFERLGRKMVLALQDDLLNYMRREFNFSHVGFANQQDAMHFHSYSLHQTTRELRLQRSESLSTNADGIAKCLGMLASPEVDIEVLMNTLRKKITHQTRLDV